MAYNSLHPILPIRSVPEISKIKEIKPIQAIQPVYGIRSLQEKRDTYFRNQKQIETFLSDYNDPTELNSYIDALTNREAVSKKFGETWGTISTVSGTVSVLSFVGALISSALAAAVPVTAPVTAPLAAGLYKTAAVAVIPSIPAAIDVTVEKGIKPIMAGKPKEAAINTLMNLGETMDFAANPVKGLIQEGGSGFVKGFGLSDEGRVNYDYDTGNFLSDMLLEVVSDPLTWIDFGASLGVKVSAKTVAKQVTSEVVESVAEATTKAGVKNLTQESAEQITRQITKTTSQVAREWAEATADNYVTVAKKLAKKSGQNYNLLSAIDKAEFQRLAKEQLLREGRDKIQQSLTRVLRKEIPDLTEDQLKVLLNTANKTAKSNRAIKSVMEQIQDLTMDTMTTQTLKGLANLQHYSNSYQRFMTKGAMMSSGYGLGVEFAKEGWYGIKAWANNFTLNKLTKAQVFDRMNGLDLTKYDAAKNIWEASYKYTSDLTGDVVQRDMNSFYSFMTQQLHRDRQLISDILRQPNAIKKSAALDSQILNIYGIDFNSYIEVVKQINIKENGLFKSHLDFLESIPKNLNLQATTAQLGAKVSTGASLFNINKLSSDNIIKRLQDAVKSVNNITELPEKIYTLKMNNAYVNAMLINDPIIGETLSKISSDENIGAMLNKIIGDSTALADEVAAQIPVYARTIKEAGISFMNIKNFYDEVANIVMPNIDKIKTDDFKRYVIDQVFGAHLPVSELLANFESSTLPALKNGIETMLYDKGFKFANYPAIEEQIAGIYKRFLESQANAGIENLGATIVERFTHSVDELIKYMPEYKLELTEIGAANKQIRAMLANVAKFNLNQINVIFTDKNTIFNIAKLNTRALSDAGLALETIGIKEALNLFNISQDVSGNLIQSANRLGKSLNNLSNNLKQYNNYFTAKRIKHIDAAYTAVYNSIFTKQSTKDIGMFALLKLTNDPVQQLSQLIEFNKLTKSKELDIRFKDILYELSGETNLFYSIMHPSKIMTTDFAWEAMAQSAWIAEKQLNESIINGITSFKNLSINSKKISNDFYAMRELLSTNAIDRPKMLQQERYYKAASRVNDMLEFLEGYYDKLFNKEIADTQITQLRKILNDFPSLNEQYEDLVDNLEKYWRGELEFKQDPKYLKNTKQDFVDEFTPFWDEIQNMNRDIQNNVQEFNNNLYKNYQTNKMIFDKTELKKRQIKFDKTEWNNRRIKFNKTEWDNRKIKFDKEKFKNKLKKFDKEEFNLRTAKFDKEELSQRFKTFNIKDVNITPNMSNVEILDAINLYKQQVQDYNNVIYNLYTKDLKTNNEAVFKQYIQEIKQYNDNVYNEYINNLNENNQRLFEEYTTKIQQQNNDLFRDYTNEIWYENNQTYKKYIQEINDYNTNLYEDYASLKIKYTAVTPWDPCKAQQEFNKAITKASNANARGAFYNLFNLSKDELINELAYRSRFITFTDADLDNDQLRTMFKKFKNNLPEQITYVPDATRPGRHWFVLNKSEKLNMAGRQMYLNGVPIMRASKSKSYNEFQIIDKLIKDKNNPGITKILNELDDNLEMLTGSRLGDSQGEYLDKATLEKLYLDMPKEVQEALPDLAEYTDKQFFDYYIFNESVLGTAQSKATLGMYSSNVITNTSNAITHAQVYLKPKNEYVNAVFDSQLSISSPNSVWSNFSDESLLEGLRLTDDYKLVVLVDDPKYGMRTREILPTSIKAIQKAKELGGWIIPTQTYKDMYNVVNHRLGSTGLAKLWSRVMYMYKFGYLCRPGAWIRNWIDTNLKSKLEMGDEYKAYNKQAHQILDDVKAMKGYVKSAEELALENAWKEYGDVAYKLFKEQRQVNEFIQRRAKDGIIKEELIQEWFAKGNAKYLTYESYSELNKLFLSQDISGNVMADLYKGSGGDVWNTFTNLTGSIIDSANATENYNRLAIYLYELDRGADYTSALSKIAKTHFDYSFKSTAEQLVDMIFPFTTFSLRNTSYWVEMLEKNPWLMRYYVDLMKPSWDFKDFTPEELAINKRVQTQILYGQLKLGEFNDKVLLFKLNPSIQDAIQMFSDPINNVYEKLAAPIATPIQLIKGEYTNPTNLIPIAGPMVQSAQTMFKQKTPIPSAIGVAKKPIKFSNKNLSGTDKYTDNTYRTPRYRKNIIYDPYAVKGIAQYRLNLYPIVDVAHDIQMRYSTNVYNRIKNRVKTDVYKGIRYRIRLDVNRFR